jgi:hypothetical protein
MNPMEYFYKDRCEEDIPDFAALAVLESQHCPVLSKDKKQICISRYRIIRVLDAVSDTIRKEHIYVKDIPIVPRFRHRPMLIFGRYKDGMIQIEGYEDIREYFDAFNMRGSSCVRIQLTEFINFAYSLHEIYALHSIGTPYYDVKNLDSIDIMFYDEYLIPRIKQYVAYVGKNFNELWQRLIQKRTPIKAVKINNDFVALGAIRSMRPASNSEHAKFYELSVIVETIIKNNAKINSDITIFIDRDSLPPSLGCLPLINYSLCKSPFYLFGDLNGDTLVVKSLVSHRDAFVFGDTIYDISMGLPFKELITYFFPADISLEEYEFAEDLDFFISWRYNRDEFLEKIAYIPKCLKDASIEITAKFNDFYDKKLWSKINKNIGEENALFNFYPLFRNRKSDSHIPPDYEFREKKRVCRPFDSEGEGVWGKW